MPSLPIFFRSSLPGPLPVFLGQANLIIQSHAYPFTAGFFTPQATPGAAGLPILKAPSLPPIGEGRARRSCIFAAYSCSFLLLHGEAVRNFFFYLALVHPGRWSEIEKNAFKTFSREPMTERPPDFSLFLSCVRCMASILLSLFFFLRKEEGGWFLGVGFGVGGVFRVGWGGLGGVGFFFFGGLGGRLTLLFFFWLPLLPTDAMVRFVESTALAFSFGRSGFDLSGFERAPPPGLFGFGLLGDDNASHDVFPLFSFALRQQEESVTFLCVIERIRPRGFLVLFFFFLRSIRTEVVFPHTSSTPLSDSRNRVRCVDHLFFVVSFI